MVADIRMIHQSRVLVLLHHPAALAAAVLLLCSAAAARLLLSAPAADTQPQTFANDPIDRSDAHLQRKLAASAC